MERRPGRLRSGTAFLRQLQQEGLISAEFAGERVDQLERSLLAETDRYDMSTYELEWAARLAWRNSSRCIGRLHWQSLVVRDCRDSRTAEGVFDACVEHLRLATNRGRIRPVMTVFAPTDGRGGGVRLLNSQLIRYAGWRERTGRVVGDPLNIELTAAIERLGWRPERRDSFVVLPLAIQIRRRRPVLFDLPHDAVLQVPISHPTIPEIAELDLRWHAVPAMTDMTLRAGGIDYPLVPFNGWYMSTEIGARNLADSARYDMLPKVARLMSLDTSRLSTLWKDRALVELNVAVLHSFKRHRVTIVDHHTAAAQFMRHIAAEAAHGREVAGDWSWLAPPMSASTTPVFHRYYPTARHTPELYRPRHANGAGSRSAPAVSVDA